MLRSDLIFYNLRVYAVYHLKWILYIKLIGHGRFLHRYMDGGLVNLVVLFFLSADSLVTLNYLFYFIIYTLATLKIVEKWPIENKSN